MKQPAEKQTQIHGPHTLKKVALYYLQGMIIGIAQIIPGVSGGTLALVMGIYERFLLLLNRTGSWLVSLAGFFRSPSGAWTRQKELLKQIDWVFGILLAAGMGSAILLTSGLIEQALQQYRHQTYGFFCGLILVSVMVPWQKLDRKRWQEALSGVIAFVLLFWLGSLSAEGAGNNPSPLLFFIGGAVSISAMILPGLSGSFVLLVMGLYGPVISMINSLKAGQFSSELVLSLALFGIGMVLGLFSFARVLDWLLKKYHSITVSFLIGLMLGSLRKIFPFESGMSAGTVSGTVAAILIGGFLVAAVIFAAKRYGNGE